MINEQKIYGLLGLATKAGKIATGNEACCEGVEKKTVKLVLVATDAAERTKKMLKEKCKQFVVPIYEIATIEQLSSAIGKPNKAVIGIKEKGFAEAIRKIINGGAAIG